MASRLQAVGELQAQLDISLLFWAQTEKLLGAPGLPTFGCEFLAFTFPHGRTPSGADGKSQVLLRSEEHTSELQSRLHLVCRLLLEKKKQKNTTSSVCNT